jgi:hypothetical protein
MTALVNLPAPIEAALDGGAALAISISGGKDSQAMALALTALHRERGWSGEVFCITADLGSIEWPETHAHVQRIADLCGVPLVTVQRTDKRGLVEHWTARGERMAAQGKQARPWSSSAARFCTSDLKRDPIDAYLRRYSNVVCAVGIRAQESAGRAKQPTWARRRIHNSRRQALTWHPILAWSLLDVLGQCGHTWAELRDRQAAYAQGKTEALLGWSLHPAYVYGNERLSCQFCVLGSLGDLQNGARHNPAMLEELIAIEDRFGFTFQADRSLKTFRPQPARLAA